MSTYRVERAEWWRLPPFVLVDRSEAGSFLIRRAWSRRFLERMAADLAAKDARGIQTIGQITREALRLFRLENARLAGRHYDDGLGIRE